MNFEVNNIEFIRKKIQSNLEQIKEKILSASLRWGRSDSEEIKILPVSKGQKREILEVALSIPGFPNCFGENYDSELLDKDLSWGLKTIRPDWHYIGRLQSRKIKRLLSSVSVIQTISRVKELEILKQSLQESPGRFRGFFVQVNVSGEPQKGGLSPENFEAFLGSIHQLDLGQYFLGLMCLASSPEDSSEFEIRGQFSRLRKLRDRYFQKKTECVLSMGMSQDYEWAIAEGADLLRIGSALLGPRI